MFEIILIAMGGGLGIFFFIVLWILRKSRVLIEESDNMYKLAYVDVREGTINSKTGHVWDVRNSEPATIRTPIGTQPFYMLDYKSAVPKPITNKITKPNLLTPKLLGNLIKIETLAKFLSVRGLNKKEMLLWILIGTALGFFIGITVIATGIIPLNPPVATAEVVEPVPVAMVMLSWLI